MRRSTLEGSLLVASVSGGKDSAAMSLYLTEQGLDHIRVFADTGWESAQTYDYLDYLETELGPIHRVQATTMAALLEKKGMFPSRVRRFCTQELKIKPLNAFLEAKREESGLPVVSAMGIRAGESKARSKLPEWEWSNDLACWMWRPLIDWTFQDVVDIHRRHSLQPNPLYLQGAERVGCWPCIFARKAEIRRIAEIDPARIDLIRELEASVGPGTYTFFDDHKGNRTPIDEAVDWSRTSRGGKQKELFALEADGGMRWGLCDTIAED